MTKWVYSGLRAGIRSSRYPASPDESPGVSPGLPLGCAVADGDPERIAQRCPTGALVSVGREIAVDRSRCIHCFRCIRGSPQPVRWQTGYEWATTARAGEGHLGRAFARSVHIRVVDAGDCGACLHEVKQLANPYYNLHRLGFFITPTPRQADILLVVGPGTDQMRRALEKTYAAMPTPRLVMAVGACALSGGVFGPSFVCSDGIESVIPVDVKVPGNPPPPLAILHGLLVATGRASAARWAEPSGAVSPSDGSRTRRAFPAVERQP